MNSGPLILIFLLWNIAVFFFYAADKRRARKHRRRVPERTLLGGIGALAGMGLFRHKTKHLRFCILVPLSFVITGAAGWFLFLR